jgi:DNA-binding protein WhiA
MSFSVKVREELMKHFDKSVSCRRAELAAIMIMGGKGLTFDADTGIYVYEDLRAADRNDFTCSRKTFNINGKINPGTGLDRLVSRPETKRAFLRGAFIAAGTINDPEKEYHLEITSPDPETAEFIMRLMNDFGITARMMKRRNKDVVYVKDGEDICLTLNVISAHVALMTFENVRIEKEIRGAVNRKFNCDTANINKTVTAAMKQIEDIELIDKVTGLDKLDTKLEEIARTRLENPDATLEEIGELLSPAVGKSGVNHRMRKLSAMARQIRQRQESNKLQ